LKRLSYRETVFSIYGLINFRILPIIFLGIPLAFLTVYMCNASELSSGPEKTVSTNVSAEDSTSSRKPKWGAGIGQRYARSPFIGENKDVFDVIPAFYYEGEHFFLRGLEGGAHLWDNNAFGFDFFIGYRFFDYPDDFDDILNRNTFDAGLRSYYKVNGTTQISLDLMTDTDGRLSSTIELKAEYSGNRWWLSPLLELRAKSSDFNTRYYGLDVDTLDAGFDVRTALESRFHVWSNLHLDASIGARLFDDATNRSAVMDDSIEYTAYLGIGFYEEPESVSRPTLMAKPYMRLAQGRGNSSTLEQIFSGDIRTDEDVVVNMTSLFYGHPVSDTLFRLPIEVYLSPGIVHHYSSDSQDSATEFVLSIKFYYTIPLPWRVRLGAAEGISYIDSITYYEQQGLDQVDKNASRLLNYVDLSIDLNLGDIFPFKAMENLWFGYGIHHRSGIGGSSSTFGNVSGGSNYNTLYLQYAFDF